MSAPIRLGGRVRLDDGTLMVWSVASGRRGRRWQAVTSRDGRLLESRVLEVDDAGRPARLEIANVSGVLTLHPEPSGGLHGNVVTPTGVRHVALDWSDAHEIAVDRSPIATSVIAYRLSGFVPVGQGQDVQVAVVTENLEVKPGTRRFERISDSSWRIEGGERPRSLTIDERGIPTWPDGDGDAIEWPLELESQP